MVGPYWLLQTAQQLILFCCQKQSYCRSIHSFTNILIIDPNTPTGLQQILTCSYKQPIGRLLHAHTNILLLELDPNTRSQHTLTNSRSLHALKNCVMVDPNILLQTTLQQILTHLYKQPNDRSKIIFNLSFSMRSISTFIDLLIIF